MATAVTSLFLAVVAAGVWLIRLEGRVNTQEQLNDERFGAAEKSQDDLYKWLARIETKVDRLIERH